MSRANQSKTDWNPVNSPGTTVYLDCSSACVPAPSSGSPIDTFLDEVASTLVLGPPPALQANSALGRLLVLSLVTSVEGYFRDVLFGLTRVCPLAREKVSDESIQLGALSFYGPDDAAKGIFERVSFAGSAELKKYSRSIGNLQWSDNDSLGAAVANFEKVCHMRHAAVHSKGVLNRGNAKALGVHEQGGKRLHLEIDFSHLQASASACLALVREYNHNLYSQTLTTWRDRKLLSGSWDSDKKSYEDLYRLFHSKLDAVSPASAYTAWRKVQPSLLRRSAPSKTSS